MRRKAQYNFAICFIGFIKSVISYTERFIEIFSEFCDFTLISDKFIATKTASSTLHRVMLDYFEGKIAFSTLFSTIFNKRLLIMKILL